MKNLLQKDKNTNYNATKSSLSIIGGMLVSLAISPPIGAIIAVSGICASTVDMMYQSTKKMLRSSD